MKEEHRTEAEFILEQITWHTDAKVLNIQKDWIINAMLDFHAQQSKERDDTKIIINGNV